jgi:ABC-type antimicrobial peptide transport system permease subunit
MFVNSNTIKYKNIASTSGMTLYSSNKDEAITYLQDKGYNAYDTYQNAKEKYLKEKKSTIIQNLITSGIILCISLVEIFFITRASFISRIKEVGIYRAIGVKKSDIYKMFLGEILVITTILGVPGYILISLLLNEFIKASSFFASLYVINAPVLITSIVLIYGFNILIGLLPIRNTIKKSPAEILARTDID